MKLISIIQKSGQKLTNFDIRDEETEAVKPIKSIPAGYCFSNPNDPRRQVARQLRKELGEFLHKLVNYFRTQREDDVESLKILLKVCYFLLNTIYIMYLLYLFILF